MDSSAVDLNQIFAEAYRQSSGGVQTALSADSRTFKNHLILTLVNTTAGVWPWFELFTYSHKELSASWTAPPDSKPL